MTASTENPKPRADWFITSVDRGLRVLRSFDRNAPLQRVGDIAKKTGMSRAAARRFLMTLEELGYLGCDSEQRYFLRPLVLTLGYSYLSSLNTAELVQPILQSVMEQTGESCSLAFLEGSDIRYIARAISPRPVQIAVRPGDRLPAHATSMGRVLLAGLPEDALKRYFATARMEAFTPHTLTDPAKLREIVTRVREEGHAVIDSEVGIGIVSIAVPVLGPKGETRAAININCQSGRTDTIQTIHHHLPALKIAADQVASVLESLPDVFFRA
ncbi:IclR family transcriptional regulator C-terminal domain-containing protein [Amorphus sp. 3PC139-8]|uniref:IclR family transcriptional regulator domain-containing protein n=1 Tax=Amorphus sp. 3PC139-8 TaxID=2735676 RepID=UPI00345D329D